MPLQNLCRRAVTFRQIGGSKMTTINEAFDWRALGADVIKQAVKDLRDPNPLTALDALFWLIEDAPMWLDGLGLGDLDPTKALVSGKIKKVIE